MGKSRVMLDQEMVVEDFWKKLIVSNNIVDNRERRNVVYRHAYLMAARELSNLTTTALGRIVDRNHASVVHAVRNHFSNHTYCSTYRKVYSSVHEELQEVMFGYNEELGDMLKVRFSKIQADSVHLAMANMYKSKYEKQRMVYDEKIEMLKNEINLLSKQIKSVRKRNHLLGDECLRLKNLV